MWPHTFSNSGVDDIRATTRSRNQKQSDGIKTGEKKKKNTFISELLSFTGQKPSLWAKCGDDTSFYQSDACSDILLELK